jgi:hypothetical protein
MSSNSREVRFSRKPGNDADKSPQSSKESLWRDDGNTIPFFQSRLGQAQWTNPSEDENSQIFQRQG